ncbi:MAG: hypothetical protein HY321_10335 [Armatimonadetes bacterium]|nr:hypothetical protein [Armatimonadota bacterium]
MPPMVEATPARARGQARRRVPPFLVIAVAYLALQSQYVFLTPFISGPDEPAHLAYVASVASRREIPEMAPLRYESGRRIATPQAQHPPLYYVVASPLYLLLAPFGRHAVWVGLRLFSVLLGLVILWLCWRTATLIWARDHPYAPGMVGFIALLPTFLYSTSTTNNEPLAAAFGAAAFYAMARLLAGPLSERSLLLLGAALGLGALTKATTLGWWPAAAWTLLVAGRAEGVTGMARRRGAFLVVLPALLIPAAWWIRCSNLYGTPMPRAFSAPIWGLGVPFTLGHVGILIHLAVQILIGGYVPFFLWGSALREVPAFLGLVPHSGALLAGIVRWLSPEGSASGTPARPLAVAAILALAACILGIYQQTFFVDLAVGLSPGRYLFTYLPALAYLVSGGVIGLFALPRRAVAGYAGLGAILVGLNIASLVLIRAFFAAHPPAGALIP